MKIVSQNTPEQIARHSAAFDLDWELRELAANIIRIVRGAGRPRDLARQLARTQATIEKLEGLGGSLDAADVCRMLKLPAPRHWDEFEGARRLAIRGALQAAASNLLGQNLQQHRGEDELFDGLYEFERVRANFRKQRAAESRKRAIQSAIKTVEAARAAKKDKPA